MTKDFIVIMSGSDAQLLRASLFTEDNLENAAFALCGYSNHDEGTRLLVRKVIQMPPDGYVKREAYHLEVSPFFINKVIDASDGKLAILMTHSHPMSGYPRYSPSDDHGETRLFKVFSDLVPGVPHASLLFTESAVIGRYWEKTRLREIDRVRIVNARVKDFTPGDSHQPSRSDSVVYDRQVLAFGKEMQAQLRDMRIGIVGVGGTGSAVAEQLARIGVGGFVLVDPDAFEASNLTRMYGTFYDDIRSRGPKVKLLRTHIQLINPKAEINEIRGSIVNQQTLEDLKDCDLVFCCTDNDWSRSVLNRFAYQYLIPVIDMGVRIVVSEKKVQGAGGRVTMIGADLPCLWCSHHLSSERIRIESMNPDERKKLQEEKYIEGKAVRAPSVISLNSTLAGLGVTMLLSSISGFSEVPSVASEQLYDIMEGTVFRSKPQIDPNCRICGTNGLKGKGDLQVVSSF